MTSKKTIISPRIFLYGYYGFGNVGDDLLFSSVFSAFSSFAPNARFVVRCLSPVFQVTDQNIQFVELEQILTHVGWSRFRRLAIYALETWRSLRGCSHVVFGGGTLFHARGGASVNLALIAMMVLMARLRGAQVFALGVGVASLPKGAPQWLMRFILALTRDFAVRDKSSLANCQHFSGRFHVRCTADLVFALPLKKQAGAPGLRPVLGITLASSDIGQDVLSNMTFFENMALALEHLLEQGWEIRFLSFQELDLGRIKLSDSALFATLYRYGLRQSVKSIRVSSQRGDIVRQFSDIDLVVGMRFHGHVLAALMGIPFVGIGRDSKVMDICRDFSMPFLELNELQADRLVKAVEQTQGKVPNQGKTRTLALAAAENFSRIEASIL